MRLAVVGDVPASLAGRSLPRPTLIASIWLTGPDPPAFRAIAAGQRLARAVQTLPERNEIRSVVVLTNGSSEHESALAQGAQREAIAPLSQLEPVWLGAGQLSALLDASPEVRRRAPAVLGVRDLEPLLDGAAGDRSSWDEGAARELVRRFVPTRAYRHTLSTLERHRFAVLTGPPEMGKTAIARTVGLALRTEGWQVHECVRPDQVWAAFDPDRAQLFVADDAFGSTEYRPDAAERWALELDRVLQRLDDRHWLVWTSRPAPLKAGLGRIHREHGVERFPQPAEVQVDASSLDLEEKALILYRHARAAALPPAAIRVVRRHGETIVEHPHFTPGRIGRFVETRLPQLATAAPNRTLRAAIEAEIAEPTAAMAASLRALPPEHRALLVALVDQRPGPVAERELAATARRHAPAGLPRQPAELVDRLTDHFVRVIPPATVTWVHPSWRDLVIDELAGDAAARQSFLERCSLDGLLLALSHGGGPSGRRSLPLLVEDADWDAAAQRIHELVPGLDDADLLRLLANLEAALGVAGDGVAGELRALIACALERMSACWERGRAAPDAPLLERWLEIAAWLPEPLSMLDLGRVWGQSAPPNARLDTVHAVEQYARWLRIAALLERHAPGTLAGLGFPAAHEPLLHRLFEAGEDNDLVYWSEASRRALSECFAVVEALVPARAAEAAFQRRAVLDYRPEPPARVEAESFPWTARPGEVIPSIVHRILADLGPA